jgi:hypothetical protein
VCPIRVSHASEPNEVIERFRAPALTLQRGEASIVILNALPLSDFVRKQHQRKWPNEHFAGFPQIYAVRVSEIVPLLFWREGCDDFLKVRAPTQRVP